MQETIGRDARSNRKRCEKQSRGMRSNRERYKSQMREMREATDNMHKNTKRDVRIK
jgi:hypothetical protein